MRLPKLNTILWAVVALLLTVAPRAGAQSASAKKVAHKGQTAATTKAPATAPAADPDPAGGAPVKSEVIAARRDPFQPLVSSAKPTHGPLPPGKAGLIIGTVRVDGTVKSPSGMLAVVSNEEQRVYFSREGDKLYDGDVEKIGLDGVTFTENSKDAFGKPVERMVTKRIYQSAGEQQ
jgi:hypothetical protein